MNQNVLNQIRSLSNSQKAELLDLLEEYEDAKQRELSHDNYLNFVQEMWSAFIHGKHHEIMAEAFEKVARGEIKRLIINMPPIQEVINMKYYQHFPSPLQVILNLLRI